ncbi:MAG: hypothetical protein U0T32_01270 [Chitinophagales bacterium]
MIRTIFVYGNIVDDAKFMQEEGNCNNLNNSNNNAPKDTIDFSRCYWRKI